eukprot:7922888-Pyramimonas_sp.AAC.1
MNFNPLLQERIGNLLASFEILGDRAQRAGQPTIGHEGLGYLLLRAVGASSIQLAVILQRGSVVYPANARK